MIKLFCKHEYELHSYETVWGNVTYIIRKCTKCGKRKREKK